MLLGSFCSTVIRPSGLPRDLWTSHCFNRGDTGQCYQTISFLTFACSISTPREWATDSIGRHVRARGLQLGSEVGRKWRGVDLHLPGQRTVESVAI